MEFSIVNLLLVLLVAWVSGTISTRYGYPAVLGELAAGILFGPAVLGLLHPGEGLSVLAELGVFLMMLYIGMEVDYRDLAKASWPGFLAAAGGFSVPLVLGYTTTRLFGYPPAACLFLGLAMGVTSLATKSRILFDLDLLGTRIANVLFAAALICDTAALVVFAAVMGLVGDAGLEFGRLFAVAFKAVLFFGATILIGLRLFPWIGRTLRALGFTERTANFTMVVMMGLVFAELAELAGLHSILGAFLAGLFLRGEVMKREISHEVTTLVRDMSLGFLAPIFFVSAGFHVDFGVFLTDLPLLLLILFLAFTGKIVGATLFYLPSRNGWQEGLTIGAGMNGHGAVEIIIAGLALEQGLISQNLFSILIFMAFLSTATVPVLMKLGVEWLREHDLLVLADHERHGVLILGASPLARALARRLQAFGPVTLMDTNPFRVETAENQGLNAIRGNALSEDTLDVAGAADARMFLSLTTNADINALAVRRVQQLFGIPAVHSLPLEPSPAEDMGAAAEDEVEVLPMFPGTYDFASWSRRIRQGEADDETIEVDSARDAGLFYDELGGTDEVLPLLVERDGEVHLSGMVDRFRPGDRVHLLRHASHRDPLENRFKKLVLDAPYVDYKHQVVMEDLFREVADVVGPRLDLSPKWVYEQLMIRETDSSTVIFPGVAVPHIMIEGEGKCEMMLVRCREGASFSSAEEDARIIFFIAGTRDERQFHLRILSSIAQLFQDPTFEERWHNAESEADLKHAILSTRRSRS